MSQCCLREALKNNIVPNTVFTESVGDLHHLFIKQKAQAHTASKKAQGPRAYLGRGVLLLLGTSEVER